MTRTLRIGTRRSRLALIQTEMVRKAIEKVAPDISFEIIEYTTTGDKFLGDLSKVGGKGVFVKEIEDAMLKGEIDIAMHSMKDMPNHLPEGLVVAGVLPRDDIRDAAICKDGVAFEALAAGSKIGTSSLRRSSQLNRNFPHLTVVPLRGNLDTRLNKLKQGEVDAIILAKAGLDRMAWNDKISLVFEPDMMLPAVGQGAVGIECKASDTELLDIIKMVNCEKTFTCVTAEREMSLLLGGNCQTPIAGFCEVTKGHNLRFIAHVTSPDGSKIVRAREKMPYDEPKALGRKIAEDLLSQGAQTLIEDIKASA
tara:strand:+ start:116801 stop:117730 length:930 start_codon:yes stop_codon:yes gene_type:complete